MKTEGLNYQEACAAFGTGKYIVVNKYDEQWKLGKDGVVLCSTDDQRRQSIWYQAVHGFNVSSAPFSIIPIEPEKPEPPKIEKIEELWGKGIKAVKVFRPDGCFNEIGPSVSHTDFWTFYGVTYIDLALRHNWPIEVLDWEGKE